MTEKNAVTLQALLRLALPLNTTIAAGDPETAITWAITIRAATDLPEIYGGEMAIIAVDMLQSVRKQASPAKVVEQLAHAKVAAIAIVGNVSQTTIAVAQELGVALLLLPEDAAFTGIERAVNKAILNQSAQLAERAIEIQRKLTRLAAENRDLNSLLQ
ncbi:MAG: PucR family transcriptional regulator ligand-binding domain-containing protein, partial [Anaerolineae bacterium]|nr:PucR family transcriptional regulator ligand-binding domain-containing protein [Anaerolineae bacterium]